MRPRGQSMLELIVAIGIIVSSVVATIGLVIATTTTSAASKAQILAANLAREGVEVVRSLRDTNWLVADSGFSNVPWNAELVDGTPGNYDYTAIASFQPSLGIWALLFGEDDINDVRAGMYLNPTNGIYAQFENPPLSCPGDEYCNFQPIQYWRLITMLPVCWLNDDPTSEEVVSVSSTNDCTQFAGHTQVGVEVRSRVRWLEHGRPHTTEIIEKLFDWKS